MKIAKKRGALERWSMNVAIRSDRVRKQKKNYACKKNHVTATVIPQPLYTTEFRMHVCHFISTKHSNIVEHKTRRCCENGEIK